MDTKRTTSIYAITNNKIDSLRAFLSISKEMYHSNKNDLNNNDFLEWLKLYCYQIEEEIENTIDYYQHNNASLKIINKAKDKCKDLSILLNKFKLELLSFGFGANEYSIYIKERKDAFDFDKEKKDLIENHLEIKKEFKDCINIEKSKEYKKNDEDKLWFKVGIKFATGEIQSLLKTNNPSQVAKQLDNENFRPYITSTIGTEKVKTDKNIYNRKRADIEAILNYCLHYNLEVCKDFKDKTNHILTD